MSRTILGNEARRRHKEHNASSEGKPNSHAKLSVLTEYLEKNPIKEDVELLYLKNAMAKFGQNVQRFVATANNGLNANTSLWRGFIPFLRLYHAIITLRDQFVLRDNTLTRRELDDSNRQTFWDALAALFNNVDFKPVSTALMMVHDDFLLQHDLSIDKNAMPVPTTGIILKKKVSECRYKLLTIMKNYEVSGMGDGAGDGTTEDPIMDGSDRANFLGGHPSHILYLWQLCEDYDLLESVKSVLPEEVAVSSDSVASISSTASMKKRKAAKEEKNKDRENTVKFRKNFQNTFDSLVGTMKNDNMMQAIEALSRYEEKLHMAIADDKPALVAIFRDKVKRIQAQIEKMEGPKAPSQMEVTVETAVNTTDCEESVAESLLSLNK